MTDKTSKTIIEKFGFKDEELTTPEHDKIMLWTYKNWMKTIKQKLKKEILQELINNQTSKNEEEDKKNSELVEKALNNIPPHYTLELEKPILNNKFNIGFIDASVFLDFTILTNHTRKRINFEIKPIIKSIGETIRQIQFYKSHDFGEWIIITKTKGLKQLFKEQNIEIYEITEEELKEV